MGFFSSGFQTERMADGHKRQFFGKYRAIVTNVMDSDSKNGRMGRVKVSCPKVLGDDESDWCTPCMPFAGKGKGFLFMPKVGDTVWVEFEEGDPDKPIWVGNWWGTGERPGPINDSYSKKQVGQHHVIETDKVKIHFNDKDEYLHLKVGGVTMKWDGKSNTVSIVGDVTVKGDITATGQIKSG